jgi:2-(1,2-epoxy-1,2-dihydrophenyl)acetyl-CoA isomerase
MTETKLLREHQDGILTLTLNRPGKLNAIDNDLAKSLLEALHDASADTATRVIRIRGEGRAFCAGRDVSAAPTDQDLELVQAVARAIVHSSKPVVAQVHGWTVGAGFEWTLDADIVIAAEATRFKLPEASLGVFVTGGLTATLPAMAGVARAKALMLLGDEFSAQEALAWGLLYQVVPNEDLEQAGWLVSQRLAALAPGMASHFKRVLNDIGLGAFERAVLLETETQRALSRSGVR